jgi:hypothetical protein
MKDSQACLVHRLVDPQARQPQDYCVESACELTLGLRTDSCLHHANIGKDRQGSQSSCASRNRAPSGTKVPWSAELPRMRRLDAWCGGSAHAELDRHHVLRYFV